MATTQLNQILIIVFYAIVLFEIEMKEASQSVSASQAGPHSIRRLTARFKRMQALIEGAHFVEASNLANSITSSVSPMPDVDDLDLLFRLVNQSLNRYVPWIATWMDTAQFQAALTIYYEMLWFICKNDHLHDADIRLMHVNRMQNLLLSILKGIEKRVGRSYHRYHEKYKELQRLTERKDELYIQLDDPVPCRWMRLFKDATSLQSAQPLIDGSKLEPHSTSAIERIYTNAIQCFVKENNKLTRAAKVDEAVYPQLFRKFSWIAEQLPVSTALEYCVSLSKDADWGTDAAKFQHIAKTFYYDQLVNRFDFA